MARCSAFHVLRCASQDLLTTTRPLTVAFGAFRHQQPLHATLYVLTFTIMKLNVDLRHPFQLAFAI